MNNRDTNHNRIHLNIDPNKPSGLSRLPGGFAGEDYWQLTLPDRKTGIADVIQKGLDADDERFGLMRDTEKLNAETEKTNAETALIEARIRCMRAQKEEECLKGAK